MGNKGMADWLFCVLHPTCNITAIPETYSFVFSLFRNMKYNQQVVLLALVLFKVSGKKNKILKN